MMLWKCQKPCCRKYTKMVRDGMLERSPYKETYGLFQRSLRTGRWRRQDTKKCRRNHQQPHAEDKMDDCIKQLFATAQLMDKAEADSNNHLSLPLNLKIDEQNEDAEIEVEIVQEKISELQHETAVSLPAQLSLSETPHFTPSFKRLSLRLLRRAYPHLWSPKHMVELVETIIRQKFPDVKDLHVKSLELLLLNTLQQHFGK